MYADWTRRLQHPLFGLSCLFVCQNASAKLGIRLLPSLRAALASPTPPPGPALAFAVAALLRFLTPLGPQPRLHEGVFRGKMDDVAAPPVGVTWPEGANAYAGDLTVDFAAGVYDFRDGDGAVPRLLYGKGGEG